MPSSSPAVRNNDQLSKTNLYIRGLKEVTSDEVLRELCQEYGKIVSTKAIIDNHSGKCKGYGFVDFETAEAASRALAALSSKDPTLHVQMAKQQPQDPTNLYISNLPRDVTESNLSDMFSRFGKVVSTRILRDEGNNSRGVGFVRLESQDACERAIQCYNQHRINGEMSLTVKFADQGKKPKQTRGMMNDRSDMHILPFDTTGFQNGVGQQHPLARPTALFAANPALANQAISAMMSGANGPTGYSPQQANWLANQAASQLQPLHAMAPQMLMSGGAGTAYTHNAGQLDPSLVLANQLQQLAIANGAQVSAQQSNGGGGPGGHHQFLLSPAPNTPYTHLYAAHAAAQAQLHALHALQNAAGQNANNSLGQSGYDDSNNAAMMGSGGAGGSVQQGSGGQSGTQSGGSGGSSGMGGGAMAGMDPAEMYRFSQAYFRNPAAVAAAQAAAAAVAGGPSK